MERIVSGLNTLVILYQGYSSFLYEAIKRISNPFESLATRS